MTFEEYVEQFRIFAEMIPPDGSLIYCSHDPEVVKIAENLKKKINLKPYKLPDYHISNGITSIILKDSKIPLRVFGKHNLLNINGARLICNEIGISDKVFYEAIGSYKGASNRLELINSNRYTAIYKDFAHSPSKLKATIEAVNDQYPGRKLVACMELHTFSSLNKNFLSLYKNTMDKADIPIIYYNPHTVEMKQLPALDNEYIKKAFGRTDINVFTDSKIMIEELLKIKWNGKNLLIMSSGNFNNISFDDLTKKILR